MVNRRATASLESTGLRAADLALFATLLLVDSLHFVFARALLPLVEPIVSATYVIGIATIGVGAYGLVTRKLSFHFLQTHLWFFVAIGFLVAASTDLNYSAVAFIDAGTAAMLGKMSTVFGIGIGVFWLRDRLNLRQVVGAAIATLGVFFLTFQPGNLLRLGSLMIVGGTLLYALHTGIVKRYGNELEFSNFFFFRLLFTTLFLAAFALTQPVSLAPPPNAWLLLLVAGTVDVIISRSLYYVALRRLTMSVHAIILTLSPVATILWSLFLFNTFPGTRQLVGGSAVLVGVLLATLSRRPNGK